MKTDYTIQLRVFPVTIRDNRTGQITEDKIFLDKEHLQAAELVGQSSKELICRLYNRNGFKVLDIGTAERRTVTVNLAELYRLHGREVQQRGE